MADQSSSNTVLVIDDDEGIRFVFKLALERAGWRVETAADGREGLDRLDEIPRSFLILLDLMMPVMDGWQVLDELGRRSEWRDIPVVVCTAFVEPTEPVRGREVLCKPVDLQFLMQTVQRWAPNARELVSGESRT